MGKCPWFDRQVPNEDLVLFVMGKAQFYLEDMSVVKNTMSILIHYYVEDDLAKAVPWVKSHVKEWSN